MLRTEPRPFTVADYMSLPEHGPRYQLVDGELYMAPAPNRHHHFISGEIEYAMRDYLKRNPMGAVYDAPFDVQLTDTTVVQPDISFSSRARFAYLTEGGDAYVSPDPSHPSPAGLAIDLSQVFLP